MLTRSPGEGVDGTTWTHSLHSRYCFRHLSPAIGTKQNFSTVDMTVKFRRLEQKARDFR